MSDCKKCTEGPPPFCCGGSSCPCCGYNRDRCCNIEPIPLRASDCFGAANYHGCCTRIAELEAERDQLKAQLEACHAGVTAAIDKACAVLHQERIAAEQERDKYKARLEACEAELAARARAIPLGEYCSACDGPCIEKDEELS